MIVSRIRRAAFCGSSQPDVTAIEQFSHHDIKPFYAFEPPVSEEYSVKSRENNRTGVPGSRRLLGQRTGPQTGESQKLSFPAFYEMCRVLNCPVHRHCPVIRELCIRCAGDPVILHS